MNSKHVTDKLGDYRSGLLSRRQTHELEKHCAVCFHCRQELARLDSVLELLDANVSDFAPPAGLWSGIYAAISRPAQRRDINMLRTWFRPDTVRAVAGFGAAAIALAAAVIVGVARIHPDSAIAMAPGVNEYVSAHTLNASHAPFADRVGQISTFGLQYPGLSDRGGEAN